ncbi:MAG: carboxypeptidase regulatory-like domain-containing protein, partial [Bryobacterales bacterium]|nr:carboxypeptidase regulatory-like domain-containing protein [Bryobacterales bacterium]
MQSQNHGARRTATAFRASTAFILSSPALLPAQERYGPKKYQIGARFVRLAQGLLCLLLLSTLPLAAQENFGSILGTVTDSGGGVVTGAKITISSPNVPQPLETVSDDSG